ncbi:DUF5677 domain-containing protein [Aneurinibacillus aneurinilyticus]|nr:DUF5677 domain-containing protein [Aneurinibacillus aneurinilyticus]MED0708837.1 DUF5677 domain-containing protein [Aneurinibacillus aneurinilyticus]MED0726111.1 DUF5677 domain-containing protein [Aneurinibacillus aneurinilyticus]MED0741087.1 DUF5677 domain-containing protein [Aneurinibacillus aneurinilyticus]
MSITSNIKILKRMLKLYIELNKQIVDVQALAVVPAKRASNLPVNDLDIEEDFIFFCFSKFTKTILAIDKLIKSGFYEDALILTRSNYENFINSKAVVINPKMIDHLVEYKLGLINEKKYKFVNKRKSIIANIETNAEIQYINTISKIAKKSKEQDTYRIVYSYLCDITHCNIITSGYYRNGIQYSYELKNEIALYNALLWSVFLNIKFYNVLIVGEIFEYDELEEAVLGLLLNDNIKFVRIIEDEIKRFRKDTDADEEEKNEYERKLKIIMKSITLDE